MKTVSWHEKENSFFSKSTDILRHSCQSGSGFSGRVGLGPGSGLDFEKLSGFNRAGRHS